MNCLRIIFFVCAMIAEIQFASAQNYSQELVNKANAGDTNAQNSLALCYANGDGVAKDITKAIELWKKAADAGNQYAMSNLAVHYEQGNGVQKDSLTAFNFYLKAAEKNYSKAQQSVGWYYYYGKGGKLRNYEESLKWFEKSGTSWSHYMAGWQYEYGQGTQKDFIKSAMHYGNALPQTRDAFNHLKAYADKGYVEAMYQLGRYYESQGRDYEYGNNGKEENMALAKSNYDQSRSWLEKAANMKHGEAAFSLGCAYSEGRYGVEENDETAVKWFRIGESVGHVTSIEWLAQMVFGGEGTEVDYNEVVRLCNKGIQIMEDEAQKKHGDKWKDYIGSPLYSLLGDCYLDGLGGLPKDGNKAFELYSIGYDPESSSNQGYCHRYGIGTPKDYQKAFECYKDAADGGGFYYLWNLGNIYEEGEITQKDTKKAFEIYEIVSNEESAYYIPEARNDLARCYLNGIGTTKDEAKAFHWYKLSADDQDEDGQCNLGICYYNGFGVQKDYKQAYHWFCKTIDDHRTLKKSTYSTALEYLSKCYRFGRGCTQNIKKADECMEKAESLGSTTANDIRKQRLRMARYTR